MTSRADLVSFLRRLQARRDFLPSEGTTFYRAAHLTETGGTFTLERAGEVGVLSLYSEFSPSAETTLAAACAEGLGLTAVYVKRRPQEAAKVANSERDALSPSEPIWGEALEEVTALEEGVPFLIRPGADLSIGLFSDMRPTRAWLASHAAGRVLNTFAYTCGFGVAAKLGDADGVKNVDASRKVLAWGQENYALSGLDAPDEDFIFGDVFDWLSRFAKREQLFDTVILDPPSFARNEGRVWRSERDYGELVTLARRVVSPGGRIVACTNHAGVSERDFERTVRQALGEAVLEARFGAGVDYPNAAHLKVLVFEVTAADAKAR
ncbi:class I SAM-dependent rRNA methyltransferase [Deinococcus yavapaiensis]|uniref:23S rRNA (Cytosine1962-C5)-methyltransferase n=1 Tax=Deinococcus yavapaiensis KR-236 TaxID=694435 RepID=A0A318SA17_9DEIO|nr:class I SAM-dependent methyltransferase [Deinococcus yavapaiensis]PYE55719.1 23S rRNA (cytosine1962-C5)-methyltransferase [Deinococcus yavapaiensis KR-236]